MATTAFQTQYRQELVLGFQQRQSLLLGSVTNEAVIKGNTATFLVSGATADTPVTRGTNGLIPYKSEDLTQTSATLVEYHAPYRKTGFNIFASQGDQKRSMQEQAMASINTKLDALIIAQLDTATNDTGTSTTGSLGLVAKAKAILGSNFAGSGQITCVISDAFHGYLMQTQAFTSADYYKPAFAGEAVTKFRWFGIDFIVHSNLTGKGTATEFCYMYNKAAIGCAMDVAGLKSNVGYNEEQDYSFAKSSFYGGAVLLQNAGVVQIKHDATAMVAS